MKKAFVVAFILLVITSFSACVQKEPTPQALIEEIEDVDKYSYSIEYHQETQFSNVTIYSKGGFNYDREEAFWETKVIREDITYINETILGDFMYFSYAVEKNGHVIQKGGGNTTIQEYFEKLKDGLSPHIKTPEDLKYELLKGAELPRNPLYFIKKALNNATNFEVAKGDGIYLVAFNFTTVYEPSLPENVSEAERAYYEAMKYRKTSKGFIRIWVKDNLPIKGEIKGITIFEIFAANTTSTSKFSAKFEITYDYKRPEWIKKVIE